MSSAADPAGTSQTDDSSQPLPGQTSIYAFLNAEGTLPCSD